VGRYTGPGFAGIRGPCANEFMQGDNWNDLLKEVVTFDSVEEFWGVYVGSRLPSSTDAANADFRFEEQHYTNLRACVEIRLPPVQARCSSRVGGTLPPRFEENSSSSS